MYISEVFQLRHQNQKRSRWLVEHAKTPTPLNLLVRTLRSEVSDDLSFEDLGKQALAIDVPAGLSRGKRRIFQRILREAETGLRWKFRSFTDNKEVMRVNIYSPWHKTVIFPNENILADLSLKTLGAKAWYVQFDKNINATCAMPVGTKDERYDFLKLFSAHCEFSNFPKPEKI